jgi:Cytochrome c554 and c-prime
MLRARSLVGSVFLCLGWLTLQAQPKKVQVTCASCHSDKAATQPQTPMGRAMQLPGENRLLAEHPKLTIRKGDYTYTVETQGSESIYRVSDGTHTVSLPIRWGFGAGAQTWVLEIDGHLYESLVSYYPAIGGLDITTGDEKLTPKTVEEATGRKLTENDGKACFGCHATGAVRNGKLNLESLHPGVTCEHCHSGASAHLADAWQGKFNTLPPDLRATSAEDLAGFCGQCHRTWETVVRSHWLGAANVRFQPYRLSNSKCFNGTDPRISCVACHDPHRDVVRELAFYDAKCMACHAPPSGTAALADQDLRRHAATQAKLCPVSKSNCVRCHMPKVTLPGGNGHLAFTDHQIRVVHEGEPYPN